MSVAWHARQRGLDVLVLDAAFAGAATPASAGVLWPLEALQPDSPYWPWLEEALPLWADWPQRAGLASEAVGFTHPGLLRLDAHPGELRRGERWREARESCPAGGWVEQARRISPADWQQALRGALQDMGVGLMHGRLQALPSSSVAEVGEGVAFGRMVLATGAWPIAGMPAGLKLCPVRGQMLELELQRPWEGPVLHDGEVYLLPVSGTCAWLGATLETVGYEATVSSAARTQLEESASRIRQIVGPWVVRKQWAGLRPRAGVGEAPVVGCLRTHPHIAMANGLYRLGLSVSPAVGQKLAAWATAEAELPFIGEY